MDKPIIGITIGDPSGAGPEVTLKALKNEDFEQICKIILFGDINVINRVRSIVNFDKPINILNDDLSNYDYSKLNLYSLDNMSIDYEFAKIQAECGKAAFEFIKTAIEMAMSGKINAVVTGPISKEALNLAGYHYSGHTEIFADLTGTKDYAMMLVGGPLRVIHVSTHVSLREACDIVKTKRVYTVIKLANDAMKALGITKPKIAVAGLNPHASENGLFGYEELNEIIPAIEKAKNENIDVKGPLPSDTVFIHCKNGLYDIAVVMYHDQGHIPLKLLDFMGGVNITVGLPIIRTSVDHGTVFGKAGKGTADESSMTKAIQMAIQFAVNKKG